MFFRPAFSDRLSALMRVAAVALAALLALSSAAVARDRVSGIRDTETESLIRAYATPIFRAAGLDPTAVRIYVINDPSINAFVTNGQAIYVHTGLFMQLDTPNELIGILAHEAAHIAGGHLARRGEGTEGALASLIVSTLAGIAMAALGAPQAGIGLIAGGQHIAQRSVLAYSRVQEAAADQAGMDYLEATGQSGMGMLRVFERFRGQEALLGRAQDPYVRSHPLSGERIAALERRVNLSPYRDVPDSAASFAAYEMVRAKIRGFTERPDIVFNRYPTSDRSAPARYARSVAHLRTANLQASIAELDSLLAEQPQNPFVHELKGQILVEVGRPADAIRYYRTAAQLLPDAPLVRINFARAMLATEDPALVPAALDELRAALAREPDNAFGWFQAAIAYGRSGDEGMANLATAERHFYVGDLRNAMQFAMRAERRLGQGSAAWQRAQDIKQIAESEIEERRR